MKQMTSTLKTLKTSSSNIGFAGELVSQGNWFRRGTGFAGKLFFCYPWLNFYQYTCGEKQITYNAKVSDITIL